MKGFSLIELIIAMTLASMLILAMTKLWLAHKYQVIEQSHTATLFNKQQQLFYFIQQTLPLAGSQSITRYETNPNTNVFVFDTAVVGGSGHLTKDGNSDELAFYLYAEQGCTGNRFNSKQPKRLINHIYVQKNNLRCRTYWADKELATGIKAPNNSVSLIEGIDNIQFSYAAQKDNNWRWFNAKELAEQGQGWLVRRVKVTARFHTNLLDGLSNSHSSLLQKLSIEVYLPATSYEEL